MARPFGTSVVAALLLAASAGAAFADKIDGDWCSADGRRLSIDGPAITTPSGTATTGTYSRHAFAYTVPVPEQQAGAPVSLRLLNEFTVHLTVGAGASVPVEVWTRCSKPVS